MKTKEELVLDFMLALAGNTDITSDGDPYSSSWAKHIRECAEDLTFEYMKWVNGETE